MSAAAAFQDRVFFRLHSLALDFDGSPVAYGTRDQGQENICVGLAPNSGECRGRSGGKAASGIGCTKVCQQVFSAWVKAGSDFGALGKTMCAVGLGGGGCPMPHVRLQDPPHADFFVTKFGVSYGDIGLALCRLVPDGGPVHRGRLLQPGRGSVALLKALKPGDPPRLTSDTSAMGEPVERYKAGAGVEQWEP